MIINYFNDELTANEKKKKSIEKQIENNLGKICKISTEIVSLEKEEKNNTDILYPRVIDNKNLEKIKQLKNGKKSLEEDNKELSEMLIHLSKRMFQIEEIISNLNEEKGSDKKKEKNVNVHLKMLEAQELERQRIARELHDSTVQNLTNLVHKLEYISKIVDMDSGKAKLELILAEKNVRSVINEMREVIYNLRPMSFEDIGIDVTIERELIRLNSLSDININYNVIGSSDNIKPVICLTILRIVQEACNNAIKHSDATEIDVKLNYNQKGIELEISDNGKGFNIKEYDNKPLDISSGFGISMMKERVFMLSGVFKIDSKKNKGTKIYVFVPLD